MMLQIGSIVWGTVMVLILANLTRKKFLFLSDHHNVGFWDFTVKLETIGSQVGEKAPIYWHLNLVSRLA